MSADPRQLAPQTPFVNGRFEPERLGLLGETLSSTTPPGSPTIRVESLLDGSLLDETLDAYAAELDDVDPPIAASSWFKRWVTLVTPGILAAWTLFDVGVEVPPGNVAVVLDGSRPVRAQILDPTRACRSRPERDRAVESLFGEHLVPLVARIQATTGLAPSLLWGSTANIVAYLFDRLDELDLAGRTPQRDRATLLSHPRAPWGELDNPLAGTLSYEALGGEGLPDRYQVRDVCCLKREIPGKPPCASCPRISRAKRREIVGQRRRSR